MSRYEDPASALTLGQHLMATDAELASHVAGCPDCNSGRGCPDGDATADAEYRAFSAYRQANPDDARRWVDHQVATCDA